MHSLIWSILLLLPRLTAFAQNSAEPLQTKEFATEGLDAGSWVASGQGPQVVEEKFYTKVMKLEVTPYFGWVPTDSFEDSTFWGGALGFHLWDSLGVGLGYFRYRNKASDLTKQFSRNFGVNPEFNSKRDAYYGQVYWTPVYAKLAFLGRKLSHYELYFGAGVGRYNNTGGSHNSLVGSVGNRFFIFPWLNVRAEYLIFRYKDNITYTTGLDRGKSVTKWRTPGQAWIGLSVLFP